jgi:hypothetical protein
MVFGVENSFNERNTPKVDFVVEDYGYFDSFFFWCRTKHLYLLLLFYFVLLSGNVYFLLIN